MKYSINRTLLEVGERKIVHEITKLLTPSNILLDGFGHDAAFVDISVSDEEVLVINTDKSGLNIAYKFGLADAKCVGDFGVSHAISDVVAAGGCPKTVTIALLLPPDTSVSFVKEVMKGAEQAADRYGAIITGGDTKKNPKFAMVVTAVGVAHRDKRLRRSSAQKKDMLVVTGNLGSMLLATIAFKKDLELPHNIRCLLENSLIKQNPPFKLGRALADAGVANACMDISDGLAGTLFSICKASGVGAVIDESKLPIDPDIMHFARSIGIRPMQLTLGGGDWQYLYTISENKLQEAERIANDIGFPITVIGQTLASNMIAARTLEGHYRHLQRIENDSFAAKKNGKGYFANLADPQKCFGEIINDKDIINTLSS